MASDTHINCPACGTPMNHHADKIAYAADESGGEVLEEFHRCPACGAGLMRQAAL